MARRRVVREAECGGRACDPEAGARTEPCPTVSACPCSWGAWDNWGAWSTGVYDLFRGALVSGQDIDTHERHIMHQARAIPFKPSTNLTK